MPGKRNSIRKRPERVEALGTRSSCHSKKSPPREPQSHAPEILLSWRLWGVIIGSWRREEMVWSAGFGRDL